MILQRNKHRKIILTLGVALLCFFFVTIFTHPTSAVKRQTISASQLSVVGTYSLSPSTQGATVTEDYYIYTKWTCDACKTYLIGCKRNKPSECKTLASGYWGHASTVYNKWGTDTVNIVSTGGSPSWCINFKTGKAVNKCERISPSGLSRDGWTSALQGYTKYGDYYLRGWGYIKWTGQACELRLYKDSNGSKSLSAVYYLPTSGEKQVYEIEGVGVDNNGNVYFSAKSNGKLKFFQISSSVLNLGSDGSSSSEKRTAEKSAAKKKENNKNTTTNAPSVSVYDGVVNTTFFGTIKDDGEGCGVYTILDLVMTILTIGIGISALIGISISGIIYLTAGGNVEKTTKAKRRIYEIVIGLAAYAALWAILTFLLPEFNPDLKSCKVLTSEEIAARDAEIANKRQAARQARLQSSSSSSSSSDTEDESYQKCIKNAAPVVKDKICKLKTPAERISKTARIFAGSRADYIKAMIQIGVYGYGYTPGEKQGSSCNTFVYTVMRASGVDPKFPIPTSTSDSASSAVIYNYLNNSKKNNKKWVEVKKPSEGDIMVKPKPSPNEMGHVSLVIKDKSGKLVTAEASNPSTFPQIRERLAAPGSPLYKYVFHYVGD